MMFYYMGVLYFIQSSIVRYLDCILFSGIINYIVKNNFIAKSMIFQLISRRSTSSQDIDLQIFFSLVHKFTVSREQGQTRKINSLEEKPQKRNARSCINRQKSYSSNLYLYILSFDPANRPETNYSLIDEKMEAQSK